MVKYNTIVSVLVVHIFVVDIDFTFNLLHFLYCLHCRLQILPNLL